ncbi:MAG: sporulation protein YtxC [Bacillota bacterium]
MGITISTIDCQRELKDKLRESVGIKFIVNIEEKREFTIFEIDFNREKLSCSGQENIAQIIADIVVDSFEEKLIRKIVNHRYGQFSREEGKCVVSSALDILNNNLVQSRSLRKKKIINEIINYLKENKDINLEGFVRFRLQEYMKHLNMAIEQAADDLLIEKEYNDFIELLRYFVELQEDKVELVHVIEDDENSYDIYNKKFKKIRDENVENYITDLIEEEITYEDLLISALINISPKKIILHLNNLNIIDTVERIFTNRVEVCRGCDFCIKISDKKED